MRAGSVAIDSNNNLYVADTHDNRVLEFLAPLSSDEAASVVWGQANSFTTNDQNNPSDTPTANNLFLSRRRRARCEQQSLRIRLL